MIPFDIQEFEWDEGNRDKSLSKHGVTNDEAEDALFDPHGIMRCAKDGLYIHLGRTSTGRYLFQVFELKKGPVARIISSRPQTKREKKWYRGRRRK